MKVISPLEAYPARIGIPLIAKNGVPLARLVPLAEQTTPREPGGWEGRVTIADDFDAPLPSDVLAGFGS